MKKLSFILIISLSTSLLFSQREEYLKTYAQVWGFFKYHHPYPSSVDWDAQLLEDYSKIHADLSQDEFQQLLQQLFDKCTPVEDSKKKYKEEPTYMPKIFDWLDNNLISSKQKEQINALRKIPADFNSDYAKTTSVGAVFFKFEKYYLEVDFSADYRFLALARYWNAINYFFPYRELIHEDWSEVFIALLPEFENAETYWDYYQAVLKASAKIKDGHAVVVMEDEVKHKFNKVRTYAPFYSIDLEEGTFISLPMQFEGFNSPLKRGDQIIAIQGIETEERWKQVQAITPHSNDYTARRGDYNFKAFDSDSVELKVLRNNEKLTFLLPTVTEEQLLDFWQSHKKSVEIEEKMPYEIRTDSVSGKSYMYVDLDVFRKDDMTKELQKLIHQQDYIVMDVRNYPMGTYPVWTKELLKGKRHFAKVGVMNTTFPGSISWRSTQKVGGKKEFQGTLIILVDRRTQSHAEYSVMAFQQHPRAITIGGQTAGADGNVVSIPLPFGINTRISGIAVVYPDDTQTQQVGIKRAIKIRQDSSYLHEPKNDKIMEAALEVIRGG